MIAPLLKEHRLDAFLFEGDVPLLYFTKLHFSAGKLLYDKKGAKLYVDGRYYEIAKEKAPFPACLDEEEVWSKAVNKHKKIGFDGDLMSWERVRGLKEAFPKVEWVSIPSPLKEIRAIKSKAELKKLKKVAELGSQGYDYVVSVLKTGITEKEVAYLLDRFWKERGADGFSFEPIIAFGENSALPHYRAGDRKLKKGDTVLIDIGVKLEDYCSDMTRTVYFGKPPAKLKKIYEVVRQAQQKAMDKMKPGVKLAAADKMARDVIEKAGFGKEFCHSLGHGIGIEVHEWPYLRPKGADKDVPLKEGMVVTVEPGIYLPGLGGVRIEDTVEITKTGCRSLTDRPTDLSIIEA